MKVGVGEEDEVKYKNIIEIEKKLKSDHQVLLKLNNLYSWYTLLVKEDEKRMKAGRILVEGQMNDHRHISTFYHTISGDLMSLKKTLNEEKLMKAKNTPLEKQARKDLSDILNIRDTVGGAIIHIAYLYGNYDIGRYLVELDPQSATIVYEIPKILEKMTHFAPKQIGPYVGENILHMVISQRQYTETAWLLNFFMEYDRKYPNAKLLTKLLSAKTTGQFFQPSIRGENTLYFGEFPILFAVCANDVQLVRLILLGNPNFIFIRDSHGNNCLHMCVLHNLAGMYEFLLEAATNILYQIRKTQYPELETPRDDTKAIEGSKLHLKIRLNQLLVDVPNHEGHTPFTLAASLGSYDMLQMLIRHRKTHVWTYGPVVCSTVNLRGFDTPDATEGIMKDLFVNGETLPALRNTSFVSTPSKISNEERRDGKYLILTTHGAIDCLCQQSHLEILSIPEIREIIEKKWDRFGRPMFMMQAIVSLVVALLITLIIITNSVENSPRAQHTNYYIKCLYCIVWGILTLRGFSHDFRHILTSGVQFWGWAGAIRGAALLNNWCVTLEYVFFTIAIVFKFLEPHSRGHLFLEETQSLIKIFVAFSGFIAWIHMYYILMGLETTGSFVVIVSAILYNDFPQFAKLYIVLLVAFGSAYSMLLIPSEDENFYHSGEIYLSTLWNLFVYTVDGQSSVVFDRDRIDRNSIWLFELIVATYNLFCVLLLLNLLIAMMTTTYSNYVEKAHLILYREKYNIMVNFERSLSKHHRKHLQEKYAVFKASHSSEDSDDIREEITVEMHEMNSNWSHLSQYSPESLQLLQDKNQLQEFPRYLLRTSNIIGDSISKYLNPVPLEVLLEEETPSSSPTKQNQVEESPKLPNTYAQSPVKNDSISEASSPVTDEVEINPISKPSPEKKLISSLPPIDRKQRRVVKKRTSANLW